MRGYRIMHVSKLALLLGGLVAATWARPALADEPADTEGAPPGGALRPPFDRAPIGWSSPSSTWLWATPRAHVASLVPLAPGPLRLGYGYSSSGPLRAGGAVVMGLGLATLFGAGVTGI